MTGVFLSYRRDDTGPYTAALLLSFRPRFPHVPLFVDLDAIEPGTDFAERIRTEVASSTVVVVLIGRGWGHLPDEQGRRRFDDPGDYVRFELRTALQHGVPLLPVLVDGARMPEPEQLPEDIREITRRHAVGLTFPRFTEDVARLFDGIAQLLDRAGEGGAPGLPRLLAEAERAANAIIDDRSRLWMLAQVAPAVAALDHQRGIELARGIEDDIAAMPDRLERGIVLSQVADLLVPIDPDGMLHIALECDDSFARDCALGGVAEALSPLGPGRAEAVAGRISDPAYRAATLARVACRVAPADPARAEDLARFVPPADGRAQVLAAVARSVTDREHAARLLAAAEAAAMRLDDAVEAVAKIESLAAVAAVLASADRIGALRLIREAVRVINTHGDIAQVHLDRVLGTLAAVDVSAARRFARRWPAKLALVAVAAAATDPVGAEQVARSLDDRDAKDMALAAVVEHTVTTNPARAELLARDITRAGTRARAFVTVARAAPMRATRLLARAERVAKEETDEGLRVSAQAAVAGALATIDPEAAARVRAEAEATAWAAQDDRTRAQALLLLTRNVPGPPRGPGTFVFAQEVASP